MHFMRRFFEQEEKHEGRKAELEAKRRVEQTKALRQLLGDFEEQMQRELYEQDDCESLSSTEVEEHLPEQEAFLEVSS